eukprot:9540885-Ditylum_brightwellii.AAC.1
MDMDLLELPTYELFDGPYPIPEHQGWVATTAFQIHLSNSHYSFKDGGKNTAFSSTSNTPIPLLNL